MRAGRNSRDFRSRHTPAVAHEVQRVMACQLVLYPADPDCPRPAPALLERRLQALGLIGPAFTCAGATAYPVGERFLQLVTFLGCSPAIELELPADEPARTLACESGRVCHVRLVQTTDGLRFRADARLPAPRCPGCRQPVSDWPARLADWQRDPAHSSWCCGSCGYRGRLYDLNFRKHGGFGHTFIEIHGIHPAEAVPVSALPGALRELSGCDWKILYTCEH